MSLLTPAILSAYHVVLGLSLILVPVLGGAGPAVAVVIFTAAVRLCLYPLNRAQLRAQAASQKARDALAPAVRKLERRYKNDPRRVRRETFELYRAHRVPLAPGVLHGMAQIPVTFTMYRLFASANIAGHRNNLLGDRLFGVGLGSHLADAFRGPVLLPGHIAVFVLLLAAVAAVATWSFVQARRSAPSEAPSDASAARVARITALLPFGALVTTAIVPLATGLYLTTSSLWTVVERRRLQRVARS